MSSKRKSQNNIQQLILSLGAVVLFAAMLGLAISRLNKEESNFDAVELERLGVLFEDSAVSAHWKWRASGEPERILLTHYDSKGSEIGRTPVIMSRDGWPNVEPSSDGCEKLWHSMMTQPMMVNDFKVHGEYYSGVIGEVRCRYRLSGGDYFDYYVYRGETIVESERQ